MTTMLEPVDESPTPEEPKKPSRLQSILQLELTRGKVKRKALMHFSRQMAVFIKAGIPILDALDSITEEMEDKTFRGVLADMRARLAAGETFASAAAAHPEAFPAFYTGMLRSAELSGSLDTVLNQLSQYIERDLEAKNKVVAALIYPAVIAGMSVVVVCVLVGFVLPKFETFFKSLNARLPLPTRMLLSAAHGITHYWYVVLGVVALFVLIVGWLWTAEAGRQKRDRLLLRLPAFGDVLQHALLERFCRIMSSMISAGVPLTEATAVTADAMTNFVYRTRLLQAREAMMRGEGLAAPLAATGLFPSAARQMFRVGEDTGSLDEQLDTAAGYFERELDYKVKRFTALFEPAVIVAMGVVVGFVAVALISAMYGIFRQTHVS